MRRAAIHRLLDEKADLYNRPAFIDPDPVSIPHRYPGKQDREIAGFLAATFAWGNRRTILTKTHDLMERMGNDPYRFIRDHSENDLRSLVGFRHRTFNDTDLLYFVAFLHHHYAQQDTLETAFTRHGPSVFDMLAGFSRYFFSLESVPGRTRKHVASPERGSTCKRLNMFLRWMVRRDERGVDFGIWEGITPSQLICPLDVHVARVARHLGILRRKQTDWLAAVELTEYLRTLDPKDPVRYDYALFGIGVTENN